MEPWTPAVGVARPGRVPGPDDTAVLFEIVVLPVVLGLLLAVAVPRRAPYAVTARRPRGRAPPG